MKLNPGLISVDTTCTVICYFTLFLESQETFHFSEILIFMLSI